jgi:autotransporter passenger strand-loop-strand repeat protein
VSSARSTNATGIFLTGRRPGRRRTTGRPSPRHDQQHAGRGLRLRFLRRLSGWYDNRWTRDRIHLRRRTVTNTTIVDGWQQVNSGDRTTNTMIFGDSQQVNSRGVAVDTTIDDLQGGTVVQRIDAGGTASGTILNNGGSQTVGGVALGTTINVGGVQTIVSGGIALGAMQ